MEQFKPFKIVMTSLQNGLYNERDAILQRIANKSCGSCSYTIDTLGIQ